ncbi:MAG: amino acid ABC transporter substrate-binding protein [Planctomycetes bacterium]|nr:amino acid ABC transporter substrate-binding protein [Planctomycetota bacterium]
MIQRLGIVACALAFAAGCERSNRIAVIFDETGSQAALGTPAWKGAQLALQAPPPAWILEQDIAWAPDDPASRSMSKDWSTSSNRGAARVLSRWQSAGVDRADSRSSTSAAAVVGERLRREGASIALGFTDADIAAAGMRAFLSANAKDPACAAPFVIVGATDPKLPELGHWPESTFLACFTDDAQAVAAAQYMVERWGKRVVVVIDPHYDYTRTIGDFVEKAVPALGGTVRLAVSARSTTLRQQLEAAATKGVDAVFLALEPDLVPTVLPIVRSALPGVRCMGGDGLDFTGLDTLLDGATDGVAFCAHAWFGEGATDAAYQFAQDYTAAFGEAPTGFSALGYDAAMLVKFAHARAPKVSSRGYPNESGTIWGIRPPGCAATMTAELASIRGYPGVSGTISYADGPIPEKDVWIVELKKGQRTLGAAIRPDRRKAH